MYSILTVIYTDMLHNLFFNAHHKTAHCSVLLMTHILMYNLSQQQYYIHSQSIQKYYTQLIYPIQYVHRTTYGDNFPSTCIIA